MAHLTKILGWPFPGQKNEKGITVGERQDHISLGGESDPPKVDVFTSGPVLSHWFYCREYRTSPSLQILSSLSLLLSRGIYKHTKIESAESRDKVCSILNLELDSIYSEAK